jgi:hypothetical protein
VSGDLVDLDEDEPTTPAWHERTSTVVGASIGALLALFIMYFAVSCVAQEFNTPNEGPQYFIDPGGSSSSQFFSNSNSTSSTSTTSTITSTSPPMTSDINPGDTSGTTTSSSDSIGPTGATTRPRTSSGDDDSTTTRRPRFNQTRTNSLHPFSP